MRTTWRLAAAAAFPFLLAGQMPAELPPLIPREILFGNPERANPQISPDGKYLAYLAPDKKNVLQVWMRTVGAQDDKMLTADKKRGSLRGRLGEATSLAALEAITRRRTRNWKNARRLDNLRAVETASFLPYSDAT